MYTNIKEASALLADASCVYRFRDCVVSATPLWTWDLTSTNHPARFPSAFHHRADGVRISIPESQPVVDGYCTRAPVSGTIATVQLVTRLISASATVDADWQRLPVGAMSG